MHCLVLGIKFGNNKTWFHFRDFIIEEVKELGWSKIMGKHSKSFASSHVH